MIQRGCGDLRAKLCSVLGVAGVMTACAMGAAGAEPAAGLAAVLGVDSPRLTSVLADQNGQSGQVGNLGQAAHLGHMARRLAALGVVAGPGAADALSADLMWTAPQELRPEPVLFGKRKRRKAAICGDLDIEGEVVGAVPGRLQGCGATDAVRIRAVSGVSLSQHSVMTCDTAHALKRWIEDGVQPAFRKDVVGLRVAAHYACRTRNNRPGAKISEHGRGKAIDISGFVLKNGDVVSVLQGWKKRKTRKPLEKAWKAACGPFGTVLGPRADRYHQDHFHLDTARHRGGPYCR